MKLKFIKASDIERNIKATVHASGKLGFTTEAAKKLELTNDTYANIAINDEDPDDNSLYMILSKEYDSDSFRIMKAGEYYYINAKPLFRKLKIDYTKEAVVFDISEIEIDGQDIYKFARRKPKNIKNEDSEQ